MAQNTANNVDQIRDLIFGQQIKEFEEKFSRLERMLTEQESKAAQALERSVSSLETRLKRMIEALETKLDDLSEASLKERTKLRELIENSDELLQTSIGQFKNDMLSKLKHVENNAADMGQTFREEMEQLRQEIESSVARRVEALSENKLSRDTFAQVLVETAMRLQEQSPDMIVPSEKGGKEKGAESRK